MMYKKPTNVEELANVIALMELKAISQKKDLEESFAVFCDNLKPMNILKGIWQSAFSDVRNGKLVTGLIELGTGLASRKLIFRKTKGMIGNMAGKVFQWGTTGIISKYAERIKEKGGEIVKKLFKKNNPNSDKSQDLINGHKKLLPQSVNAKMPILLHNG
jgi:hypothetical protein